MTKDELEKERFVKSYPEFCYNGKPLSPYWDLWQDGAEFGYNKGKENARLESQVEQLQKINSEQKEMLKKVRIALIQERTANIMKYGKDGVEMFDSILRRVKEND